MMNEERIIRRINQVWNELLKETTIERLSIKTIQIKQLYEVLGKKELIDTRLNEQKTILEKEVIKVAKEEVIKELKKHRG